jgi:peptide/nickel transport system substrate-binding protein
VLAWSGEVVELGQGALVSDATGQKIEYRGGPLFMRRLLVTYEFVAGLTWSDGVPVSKADYELAYRAMCDPAIRGAGPFSATFPDPFPACDQIANVEFLNEAAYRVTWKPGSTGAGYSLPPFSRAPAHLVLADGRTLAEVPPAQWSGFEEVLRGMPGVGPYVMREWVYGQSMVVEANPFYFLGPPNTPRIVVKFLEHDRVIRALLTGEVDVVDWETLGPDDVEDFELMEAQKAGQVRLVVLPSSTWEHLDFALLRR